MNDMTVTLPGIFTCLWSFLVAFSKSDLLITRKHLFLYPQGDRSGLRKNKKGKPLRLIKANIIINLPKSVSNDPIIQNVLNNPLGKYGGD